MFRIYLFLITHLVSVCSGAALNNFLYGNVPDECKNQCSPFVNSTSSCIEKSGTMMGFEFNPVDGGLKLVSGNKLAIYLCICSASAKEAVASCLPCLSTKYCYTPALVPADYDGICNGATDYGAISARRAC